jgi:hypothetical protein
MTTPESEVIPSFAERLSHDSRLAIAQEWVNLEILTRLRDRPDLWGAPTAYADWFPTQIVPILEQLEDGHAEEIIAMINVVAEEAQRHRDRNHLLPSSLAHPFSAFYKVGWVDLNSPYVMPIPCRRAMQLRFAPDSYAGAALSESPEMQLLLIDGPSIAEFVIAQRIEGAIKGTGTLDAHLKQVGPEVKYFLEVYGEERRLEQAERASGV